MINVKLMVYAPFFNDVASIFGRELIYDYETGKLKGIKRYKNKQLVEIKHFCGLAESPNRNTKIFTKYDESGNVIYVENINRRTNKTRRTYNNKK